jgi:hypothetical protein
VTGATVGTATAAAATTFVGDTGTSTAAGVLAGATAACFGTAEGGTKGSGGVNGTGGAVRNAAGTGTMPGGRTGAFAAAASGLNAWTGGDTAPDDGELTAAATGTLAGETGAGIDGPAETIGGLETGAGFGGEAGADGAATATTAGTDAGAATTGLTASGGAAAATAFGGDGGAAAAAAASCNPLLTRASRSRERSAFAWRKADAGTGAAVSRCFLNMDCQGNSEYAAGWGGGWGCGVYHHHNIRHKSTQQCAYLSFQRNVKVRKQVAGSMSCRRLSECFSSSLRMLCSIRTPLRHYSSKLTRGVRASKKSCLCETTRAPQ